MILDAKTSKLLSNAARRRAIEAEARERRTRDHREVSEGVAETVSLGLARGEGFSLPEARQAGRAPIRRVAGLDWLLRHERITMAQHNAGTLYGNAYRAASVEPSMKSCLADGTGGGGREPEPSAIAASATARLRAQDRLRAMRNRLGNLHELIAVADLICGLEKTPREAARNGEQASVYTALLGVALNMLSGVSE